MPGILDADRRLKFMRAKFGNQEALHLLWQPG